MTTILRTALISAAGLCLMASSASAQVRKGDDSALHEARKQLTIVDANIRVVELRIAKALRDFQNLRALFIETGKIEYKEAMQQNLSFTARLQHQLDMLKNMAAELRTNIAKLTPAPDVSGDWEPE